MRWPWPASQRRGIARARGKGARRAVSPGDGGCGAGGGRRGGARARPCQRARRCGSAADMHIPWGPRGRAAPASTSPSTASTRPASSWRSRACRGCSGRRRRGCGCRRTTRGCGAAQRVDGDRAPAGRGDTPPEAREARAREKEVIRPGRRDARARRGRAAGRPDHRRAAARPCGSPRCSPTSRSRC